MSLYSILLKLARNLPPGHISTKPFEPYHTKHEIWELSIQKHDALRAGTHFDLRLGDPKTGKGFSWAGRYLPEPGEKRLFSIQPLHSLDYFNFEGTLPEGYGQGKVKLFMRDKAFIVEAKPDKVKFVIPDRTMPQELTLIKQKDRKWLLLNTTPVHLIPKIKKLEREKFHDIDEKDLVNYIKDENYLFSRKDDGIHTIWVIEPGKQIRAFSAPRGDAALMEHTHKFLDALGLKGKHKFTVIRGEAFAVDSKTERALPLNITSSILMSNPVESIQKQKEGKAKLKRTIFDVIYYNGEYVGDKPYSEKLPIMQEIAREYDFDLPLTAIKPNEKIKLLKDLALGRLKESKEGVVIRHLNEPLADPLRFKFKKEFDVYVVGIKEGKGSLAGIGAGGIIYSFEKDGPPVGVVGTGFSLNDRIDMWKNQKKYIGRVAKVTAKEQLPSGALRMPVFLYWHPEKGTPSY